MCNPADELVIRQIPEANGSALRLFQLLRGQITPANAAEAERTEDVRKALTRPNVRAEIMGVGKNGTLKVRIPVAFQPNLSLVVQAVEKFSDNRPPSP